LIETVCAQAENRRWSVREVGIAEAKNKLSSLLQAVERGEEIVIANRRRPVARLLPIEKPRHRPVFGSAKAAFDRSGLTWEDVDRALAP
jgi:prevent-host-death family protein